MADLSLRFLGTAEVELDGGLIHLDRRHSLALLAYLVLTDRTHSREELATLLADDVTEETARKRLRNALADLVEHGLGPFLQTNRHSIAFKGALPHHLDVRDLDALATADASIDARRLAWAAERCDRELLAGLVVRDAVQFELWLDGERERRNRQLQSISERLLDLHVQESDLDAGIALANRLVAISPWNEKVHLTLMRLLARAGQVELALRQYERCRDALAAELGVEPQPETTALFERLRTGQATPRHNLPMSALDSSDLIGREDQLADLILRLVDPTCRLLTLVGLGGSGKTRLALETAARLLKPIAAFDEHPFADAIIQVELTERVDADVNMQQERRAEWHVATSIGHALGMAFYGKIDRLSQLVAYLEPKRKLLIINNMESFLDGASALRTIVERAPQVTLLVTSRVPLGLADEWTQELGGLQVPDHAAQVKVAPASRLFLREAHRAGVSIDEADWPSIVTICRQTGGLPLALKIAAGWLGPLSCAEIAGELGQGGLLLDEPAQRRNASPTSIRSIVSAAYEALPICDQQALSRLAVFPGAFDRRAAAAIGVTAPGLVTLRQRALLERTEGDGYMLHPLVSQYAADQLARESEREAETRGHHAAYFASLVARVSPDLYTTAEAYSQIGDEKANVRAAWEWAAQVQDTDLLGMLWEGLSVWHHRAGLHREWTESLNAAIIPLRAAGDDPERRTILVQLLVAKAESLLWQGDLDGAFPLLKEARDYAGSIETIQLEALISFCEGRLLRFRGGDAIAAEESLQQARAIARATNQRRIEADSLSQLGSSSTDRENYQEAETFVRRADDVYRSLGDRLAQAQTANHLGRLAVLQGEFIQAQLLMEQSLRVASTFGDRFLEAYSLLYLGIISDVAYGRHHDASKSFERALTIAGETGDPYLDGNIHRALGRNALHMGAFPAAEQSFVHALERARDVKNTRAVTDSLRCLAQVMFEMGEYDGAEERAQQALLLSNEQGRRHAGSAIHLILGRIYERLRRSSQASAAYSQAFNLATALGIPYLRCDATTGLASVSLASGDTELAVRYVEEIVPYLFQHDLGGCEEPGWVVRTSYDVLHHAHAGRALEVLRHGGSLLERRVTALSQPQRRRYLTAFPDRMNVLQRWADVDTGNQPANLAIASDDPQEDSALLTPNGPVRVRHHRRLRPHSGTD